MAKKTYILGTAIKITSVISIDDPDSVLIKITDPIDSVKVNDANMTPQTNNVYHYIWQSSTGGQEGFYVVEIKAKKGDYTGLSKIEFELVK